MVCLLYKYFTVTFIGNIACWGGQVIILHNFYTAANKPIEERRKERNKEIKSEQKKKKKNKKMSRNEKEKVKLIFNLDSLMTGNEADKVGN